MLKWIYWAFFVVITWNVGYVAFGELAVQILKAHDDATLPESTFTKNYPLGPALDTIARADLDKVIAAMKSRQTVERKRVASKDIPAPTQTEKDAFTLAHRIVRGISPQDWAKLGDADLAALGFGLRRDIVEEVRNVPDKKQRLLYEAWAVFNARLGPNETDNIFKTRLTKTYLYALHAGGAETSDPFVKQQLSEFPKWWLLVEKLDKSVGIERIKNEIGKTFALLFTIVCCIVMVIVNAWRERVKVYQPLNDSYTLACLYFSIKPPVKYDLLASFISDAYCAAKDPFERNEIVTSLRHQIDQRIREVGRNKNVVIEEKGLELYGYDFERKGFARKDQVGEVAPRARRGGRGDFNWTTQTAQVFLRVPDATKAKAIEKLRKDNALKNWTVRSYAYARSGHYDSLENMHSVHLKVCRIEILDEAGTIVSRQKFAT